MYFPKNHYFYTSSIYARRWIDKKQTAKNFQRNNKSMAYFYQTWFENGNTADISRCGCKNEKSSISSNNEHYLKTINGWKKYEFNWHARRSNEITGYVKIISNNLCIIKMDGDLKRCCKCKMNCLRNNFYRSKNMSDGLNPQCISCRKKYYDENREKTKKYYLENRDKINTRLNEYYKNRTKADVSLRLTRNTKRRVHRASNGKTKSSSTLDILGIDFGTYRKCIEWQMTPEMNWTNIEIDPVKTICLFVVSKMKN